MNEHLDSFPQIRIVDLELRHAVSLEICLIKVLNITRSKEKTVKFIASRKVL